MVKGVIYELFCLSLWLEIRVIDELLRQSSYITTAGGVNRFSRESHQFHFENQ